MSVLSSDLRKTLETTVVKARDLAERGARDALTALAVDSGEPFASMSEEDRKLRNRLRAHGRQLGDQRDPQKGTQSIERVTGEMAYEHWHRMLFARFLAENQLLIEPTSGVAVSLDECEELAAEEGTDLWGMAAQFAQAMLPQIFRVEDPVLTLRLPLEIRQQLEGLLTGLEVEVFTASDSLGWSYQFWQTKRKADVNEQVKSGLKVGADELSPVTQLFTEDYMVDFLLDNTLGAWHAGKVLAANPQLAASAQSEEELREAVSLPGCPWSYLRFIQTEQGQWSPAAGTFEGWPKNAAEVKCLDPCMGSGHFVVAMFERMVALRMAEEGLNEVSAVSGVILDNIFGLEIDPRCTQIAAFNLALAAWRRVSHRKLPSMNLACSGLAPHSSASEWIALAGDNERACNGMRRLYALFQQAALLGSLIDPTRTESDLLTSDFAELRTLLEQALALSTKDVADTELAVTAHGITEAAAILASDFTLVATNVPYLGRRKQSQILKDYCERYHPEAMTELATCFIERTIALCADGCSAALLVPQNWLFLKTFKDTREKILDEATWNFACKMGPRAFQTPMYDFGVAMHGFTRQRPTTQSLLAGIDVSDAMTPFSKASLLRQSSISLVSQCRQKSNPDAAIVFEEASSLPLLSRFADSLQGASTVDVERFRLMFYELPECGADWVLHQSTPKQGEMFGGMHFVSGRRDRNSLMALEADRYASEGRSVGYLSGRAAWGRRGIACGWMGTLPATMYLGTPFDNSIAAIMPHNEKDLLAIWCYCSSPSFAKDVRKINQKTQVANATLVKVPFDLSHWQRVASEKYPDGLPIPFSSDATQWLFNGHPNGSKQPLHVAVARMLGYRWPRQTGSSLPGCPPIEADDIQALEDKDGIVCLSPIRGESAAADRLRMLLALAYGEEWISGKERELLLETAVVNDARGAAANLEEWLRNAFFLEHCKIFQSCPFIWHIWDGNSNGFGALVNYHKLSAPDGQGRKTLEQLAFTYLGDWIDRQKLDQAEGVNGADARLAAALDLQIQLKNILEGEPPYDIFVRWKPLHAQPIGWDPDINDGVRVNIRPFVNAQLRSGGKKGAGILRSKPGAIKWSKDRGKEPMQSREEFPWFYGWDENDHTLMADFGAPIPGAPVAGPSFDGNRWTDLHYTRAAKEAARARHRGEA